MTHGRNEKTKTVYGSNRTETRKHERYGRGPSEKERKKRSDRGRTEGPGSPLEGLVVEFHWGWVSVQWCFETNKEKLKKKYRGWYYTSRE